MVNVSLQPDPEGGTLDDLVGQVENGIYIVGDKSWSIDMQRYNFQFTGQRFFAIENGRLSSQLRDVAYQATTTDFWRSMEAVWGPRRSTGRRLNCGKAQPGQVSPASHGTPPLPSGVRILNTVQEGGRDGWPRLTSGGHGNCLGRDHRRTVVIVTDRSEANLRGPTAH
jgi:TldD protein